MSPGLRPASLPSGILIHPAIWSQQISAKDCGAPPPFWGGEPGPHLAQLGLGRELPPCQVASSSIQPSRRNRRGQQLRAPPHFGGGSTMRRGAGSPSNRMSLGLRPTSLPSGILINPAIWPQQIWAQNWGGGSAPFWRRGAGSPSNTMWPGQRPTCMSSFMLIHPAVWQQYTNITERQTNRQRSDSIGRTVLETVRPKSKKTWLILCAVHVHVVYFLYMQPVISFIISMRV